MLESGHEGISTGARVIRQDELPYSLTHRYQELVAGIEQTPHGDKSKNTGIYCPYEAND